MMKLFYTAVCLALMVLGFAQTGAETSSHLPSQAAADRLQEFAGTDGAFLAAGLIKTSFQQDNLATILQYPTDTVVVVSLTGAQLKQAFERSLSLYPQPNTSFLQLSGFEVKFNPNAALNKRVTSVTVSGDALQDAKTYTIAMPSSLGRGGLGYFKIWDKAKITQNFPDTMESVLKGKRYIETSPRWIPE